MIKFIWDNITNNYRVGGSDYHVSGGPLLVISATAKSFRYADTGQSRLEQNTSGRQWKVQMPFFPSCMGPLQLASTNIL